MKEISQKLNKIGNKLKRREFSKKREKLNKPRDLKKRERKEKAKKYDLQRPYGFANPTYIFNFEINNFERDELKFLKLQF